MMTQIHVEHVFVEREADSCASGRNCQAVVVVKDEPMDDYESGTNLNAESIAPEFSSATVKLEPRESLHGDSREQHESAETCIDNFSNKQCIVQALDNVAAADEERYMKDEINEALVEEGSATSGKESSVEHVPVECDAVEPSVRYRQTVAVKDEPIDDYESTLNTENIVPEASSAPVKLEPEESLPSDSRKRRKSAETCTDDSLNKQCKIEQMEEQEEPQPSQLPSTQPVLMAAKKIVKFSHFFIRKIKTFGNRNHELIHFISDEKDLCYSYFYERKHTGNRFSCITCSKSKHSAIAHLRCDTDSGEYFLELGLIKHICTPLNYDASVCIYILPRNFYSSMFINPSKTEKNRGFRIVSQDEAPKVVQKKKAKKARFHDTIAQMVANIDTVTIPQPQSSSLSELVTSIAHSPQSSTSDINDTVVPASSLILKAPDFELRIVKNFYGVEKYRLIVFADPDRTLCYVFFQQYPHMRFTCRKCQYYRPNITAFLRESDEGEKYVYFNQHHHQCQPLNYANVVQED